MTDDSAAREAAVDALRRGHMGAIYPTKKSGLPEIANAAIDAYISALGWEYGVRAADDEEPYTDVSTDPDWVIEHALLTVDDELVRRRPAGAWEQVSSRAGGGS